MVKLAEHAMEQVAEGRVVTGQKITWGQDFQDAAVAGFVGAGIAESAGRLGEKVGSWLTNT
ncbi:hypothetical protein SL103_17640 [Streptomyces lydicus]|uniref:Uncharacterized protein n=1 Tax=Streptomyces lydicus TaxID=47763 RepID=A0A1D7VM56_9ACTN|nr:hypothetical protein SL103_17640 [Streptomyces lydicus]